MTLQPEIEQALLFYIFEYFAKCCSKIFEIESKIKIILKNFALILFMK